MCQEHQNKLTDWVIKPNKCNGQFQKDISNNWKICNACDTEKPLHSFTYRESWNWQGFKPTCDECVLNNIKPLSKKELDLKRQWKICTKCREKRPLNEFLFDKRFDLYTCLCEKCQREKTNTYRKNNKETVNANARRWKKEIRHLPGHKEVIKAQKKRHYEKHKKEVKFNLDMKMSSGINYALEKGVKNFRRWESLVNYNLDELKQNIESKFASNMTWDKFVNGEIHLDHILPKELFEYSCPEDPQFKACWTLSNLQPLWEQDNLKKSDLLPDGRHAKNLSTEEKKQYLISLGFSHLFNT